MIYQIINAVYDHFCGYLPTYLSCFLYTWQTAYIIIMEICKAPTLRLKALNKHTHIMYIEMENVIQKNQYVYIDKCYII